MLPGSLDPGASGAVHLYGSLFGTVTAAVLFRPGTVTTAENYIPSSVSLTGNLYFLEDLIKENCVAHLCIMYGVRAASARKMETVASQCAKAHGGNELLYLVFITCLGRY